MPSEYMILVSGARYNSKFIVRAISTGLTGTYDKRDGTITRPYDVDIAQLIPARLRKSYMRTNGMFWHDDATVIDETGRMVGGNPPHLTIYRKRDGVALATLFAIPAQE